MCFLQPCNILFTFLNHHFIIHIFFIPPFSHNIHPFSDHFSSSFILLLNFFLLSLIISFSFSSPSSPLPPHPPLSQSCNTSLTEGFASVFLPLLDCDFSFIQYRMYCNIVTRPSKMDDSTGIYIKHYNGWINDKLFR